MQKAEQHSYLQAKLQTNGFTPSQSFNVPATSRQLQNSQQQWIVPFKLNYLSLQWTKIQPIASVAAIETFPIDLEKQNNCKTQKRWKLAFK